MGQIIGLDTGIFVYLLEKHRMYFPIVEEYFIQIQAGKLSGVFASIGMIELLTGPKQLGKFDIANQYRDLLTSFPNLSIIDLNETVIDVSSDLRAQYHITTPDAIHLASAIYSGANKFITNDKALKKVKEINVVLL
ncbi:MAG: PIN domain-containing protein [Patescibacteria group bacterium]|jgi:predicted nucleic acid-binding protein